MKSCPNEDCGNCELYEDTMDIANCPTCTTALENFDYDESDFDDEDEEEQNEDVSQIYGDDLDNQGVD